MNQRFEFINANFRQSCLFTLKKIRIFNTIAAVVVHEITSTDY